MVTWSMRMVSSPSEQPVSGIEAGVTWVDVSVRSMYRQPQERRTGCIQGRTDTPRMGVMGRAREPAVVWSPIPSVKANNHIIGSCGALALPILQRRRAKLPLFWDLTVNWVRNGAGPWGLRRLMQRALATTFIFGSSPTSYSADSLPASGSD